MSCLHPPRHHQSSLTTRPAFVNVLLLCNFTSKLKIDRRLGQTLFGVRKNSYKMCLWLNRIFEGREMFPCKMTTSETLQLFSATVGFVIFLSCFEHRKSCKGLSLVQREKSKRELHKQTCRMPQLNPLSPSSLIMWLRIQGCVTLQILPYEKSTVWAVDTVTADCRVPKVRNELCCRPSSSWCHVWVIMSYF